MKMNPEVKAVWVDALRSGEFKQTQDKLRSSNGYCCLGVLCSLFAKDGTGKKWGPGLRGVADGGLALNFGEENMPSNKVLIWAGLDPDATVRIDKLTRQLHVHNDTGATFAKIADAIEAQL